jgi:hypothetical protein
MKIFATGDEIGMNPPNMDGGSPYYCLQTLQGPQPILGVHFFACMGQTVSAIGTDLGRSLHLTV